MKKKTILLYVALSIMQIAFLFWFPKSGIPEWFGNNACKTHTKNKMKMEFAGVVTDKYLDEKSSLHETIIISDRNKEILFIINLDRSGLYDYINVGDSIIKQEGSMECVVIRDGKKTLFTIDFGCR